VWLGVVLGLAFLAGSAWWVANSHIFDLRTVKVTGTTRFTTDRIARMAALEPSTNVLRLPAGEVEARLERNPWILDARVSRDLPSTITVAIRERVAVAVTDGASPMAIAADGTVLGQAPRSLRVPSVTAPGDTVLAPGRRLRGLLPQLSVSGALPAVVRAVVDHITLGSPASMVLTLRDGVTVYFGDASQAAAKGRSLAAILAWATRNHVEAQYVDVRSPSAPALLPMGVPTG
jgi:cell division protein FtsQ